MKSFIALMRREYLEHRGAFLYAPLILVGVFTFLIVAAFASGHYQFRLGGARAGIDYHIFEVGYLIIAIMWGGYLFIGLFFYFADGFNADRRNNAMLFWKSLPQGDFKILMSKLVAGLTILPVLVFIAMLLTGIVAAVASFVAPLVLPVIGAPDLSGTAAAFGQISTLALVYLVLALLWYAPFFAWVGALSTVVGRWSIPLALLVPVVVSLFEGVVDFGSAPGGSYILTYLRQRMSFEFAGEDVERALAGNALGDIPGTAAKIIGGVDWLQLGIGLIFSLAVIYLASLYRRRVIKG